LLAHEEKSLPLLRRQPFQRLPQPRREFIASQHGVSVGIHSGERIHVELRVGDHDELASTAKVHEEPPRNREGPGLHRRSFHESPPRVVHPQECLLNEVLDDRLVARRAEQVPVQLVCEGVVDFAERTRITISVPIHGETGERARLLRHGDSRVARLRPGLDEYRLQGAYLTPTTLGGGFRFASTVGPSTAAPRRADTHEVAESIARPQKNFSCAPAVRDGAFA
jgi:hypothetical protein